QPACRPQPVTRRLPTRPAARAARPHRARGEQPRGGSCAVSWRVEALHAERSASIGVHTQPRLHRTRILPGWIRSPVTGSNRPPRSPEGASMTDRHRSLFVLLLVLGLIAASLAVLNQRETKLGLDLQGGVQLVYEAERTAQQPTATP